ncbi:MAG: WD40 repeat domain-containing protein [Bacteroidales bacterium]|nr:WD40 repeat domain-containing protein [Bacteroidales bacterium]MBD5205548.1 WD40 repeat domain-containing protein [Bacteroidales bacterium]
MNGKHLLTAILIGGTIIGAPTTGYAKKKEKTQPEQQQEQEQKLTYKFKRYFPTVCMAPYITTVYSADNFAVMTMSGDPVHEGNDTVKSLKVNPAGVNYGIITKSKKGKIEADIYHSLKGETVKANNSYRNNVKFKSQHLNKFDSKRYGTPTAIGYTPDARLIVVAAESPVLGKNIFFLEPKNFQPVSKIQSVPFEVEKMVFSPNGYYLAASNGNKIIIYNLEEKNIRKQLDAGEKVNDMAFNPDNSDFAVLTDDGLLSLYNTRTFEVRKMIDDLGEARAMSYNLDGKYMAIVTGDDTVTLVNLLRESDRETFNAEGGAVRDVDFVTDAGNNTLLVIPAADAMIAQRLPHLKPFYNKLIADEVERKMDEWLKMMPGETMEDYRKRVTEESRARQRRLFEDEISTNFAGDLLSGATMSLGTYDRANGVLALNFDSMPTIYLPVPESDVTSFHNAGDLTLSDVMYGILPDDSFEIVYAKVTNKTDGKSYIYDNLMRADLQYMAADDAITLEMLQQQQMEELKLQELRQKVVDEAKKMNVISDHTQIAVDSKVVPEYDANGNKILNYVVSVTYTVDPEFSVTEDFGPGKYHINESGAASSMLNILKQAFEGEFNQYLAPGKKIKVRLLGTADATPIVHGIAYDGSYGEFEEEPVYIDGRLQAISVNSKDGIKQNEQLAFLRALGVKDYLNRNVAKFESMDTDYRYEVNVSKDKGSEHRRITLELTFIDAY